MSRLGFEARRQVARTAFGTAGLATPTAKAREAWAGVLVQAPLVCAEVLESEGARPEGEARLAFQMQVAAAQGQPFPAPHKPARDLAGAFVLAAGAMIRSVRPADRLLAAPGVLELARALDAYFSEARTSWAQSWKRQLPEDDR